MIARIWHGKTDIKHFEIYTQFLVNTALQDYSKTPGFMHLSFLRNVKNNEGHFTLITYWKSWEVIKNFAGSEIEKAKYYPEDKNYLLEFEEKVQHFEVFNYM